jgi:hypothetical protein
MSFPAATQQFQKLLPKLPSAQTVQEKVDGGIDNDTKLGNGEGLAYHAVINLY